MAVTGATFTRTTAQSAVHQICPITWQNGWPMFGRPGYIGQVESRYTKPIQNKPIKVPATSDEFNSETLGLQWAWNHNPDNSKWALTGSTLRLKATTERISGMPETALHKRSGPISTGTIKIDCSGMQPGDIADWNAGRSAGVYSRYQGSQTYNNDGRGCCKGNC